MKHLHPYFSMRNSLIFLESPVRPESFLILFLLTSPKRYAAIFLPSEPVTRKVSSGIPCSRTSRPALGGWLYPYFSFNSSVVICPCFKIWSITVLGRFVVTVLPRSRNSFGYFCGITSSGLHQNKLFCFPFSVEIR